MQQPIYTPTYLNLSYFFTKLGDGISAVINFFQTTNAFFWIKILIVLVILFLIGVFVYSAIKLIELIKYEEEELEHELLHYAHQEHEATHASVPEKKNLKWESARGKVFTDNPSDWKIAIIEADVVLDDFLTERGYGGVGVGEKLKDAETQGDLRFIQDAWDAHKMRNEIAHEGGEYDLTKRDALIAITKYEKFFEEEGYIQ